MEQTGMSIQVIKRNGSHQTVDISKIASKVKYLINFIYPLEKVDLALITEQVKLGLHDGISTKEIDVFTAKKCMELASTEPEYSVLAARILVNNHHKNTLTGFKDKMEKLFRRVDDSGASFPLLDRTFYKFICTNQRKLEAMIDYQRDYLLDPFGFLTLENQYCNKINGCVVERPQDLYMKEAITVCMNPDDFNDEKALEEIWLVYDLLSTHKFTYATPTLNNSGLVNQQLSSCFVKGTPVFTINRGTVPIEEIAVGDQVATHLGNKKTVSQIHRNLLGDRQVFELKCYMTPPIQVTENHEMWSISREQLHWGEAPRWNSIYYLRTGDFIAIPEYKGETSSDIIDVYTETKDEIVSDVGNTYRTVLVGLPPEEKCMRITTFKRVLNGVQIEQDKSTKKTNRYITVDSDFAKFLGIWMGDGHIDVTKRYHNGEWQSVIRGIGVTAHADNSNLITFVCEYAQRVFGLVATKHKAKAQNCVKIVITSPVLGVLFNKLFGRFYDGKHLWPKMFDWSRGLIDHFLVGLISTDGCITDTGSIQIALSNEGLTKDIYGMCRRAGILISLAKVSMGKLSTCHSYRLQIAKGDPLIAHCYKTYTDARIQRAVDKKVNTSVPYKIIDGKIFVSILRKTPIMVLDEYVYTLGVEDDHSYNVDGLVARNCFLLGTRDSLEGINKTMDDACRISKLGGGIGIHVSNLRSAGQLIRGTNGQSSGIRNFLRMYGTAADAYNQGGKRKGSFAIFLRDYHPDLLEFIQLKNPIGDETQRARSLFLCVALSDLFWKSVKADKDWYFVDPEEHKGLDDLYGDEYEAVMAKLVAKKRYKKKMKARDLLKEIMKQEFESGVPYVINFDHINRKSNLKHYMPVKSSNLCVSGETEILTDYGHIQIKEIVDNDLDVRVWNGKEFKHAVFSKTGEHQQLMEIKTNNGESIKCTPYHKFYIQKGYGAKETKVDARDLRVGDNIVKIKYPTIEFKGTVKYPYAHGFFCGDGTYDHPDNVEVPCTYPSEPGCGYCWYHRKQGNLPPSATCQGVLYPKNPKVYLYGEKKSLEHMFPVRSSDESIYRDGDRVTIPLPLDMPAKYAVPESADIATRLEWLSGYLDADGSMARNGSNESLQVSSINLPFLTRVKRMCQTLGTNPWLSVMDVRCQVSLPDGKGGKKMFDCQQIYRLIFNSNDTYHLYDIGLATHRLKYNKNKPARKAARFIAITSISLLDKREDTYCFNEPDTHRGVFNGIIAGNCVEITLPSNHLEYAVCNLSSLILPSYVTTDPSNGDLAKLRVPNYFKWKPIHGAVFDFKGVAAVVQIITRTMDRVIDRNHYPVKEAMLSNILHRPIGIGTCGFADICCMLRIPYDSTEGLRLTQLVFETISFSAYSESTRLAKVLVKRKTDQRDISAKIFQVYDDHRKYMDLKDQLEKLGKRVDRMEEYQAIEQEMLQYPSNPNTLIVPLAKTMGVYPSYFFGEGAPAMKGVLQPDMWPDAKMSGMWDWDTLREHVKKYGLRNSLLTAQMPTASTSQIASCNEGAEPFTTNMYRRAVLSGEYLVFNRHLINDLIELGIWSEDLKNHLIGSGGSIQNIDGIPDKLKLLYRTAWDMGLKIGLLHAHARGPYLDHSQSHNIFISNRHQNKADILYKALFYGWELGLKTGMYYLRTQPAIQAQQFSVPLDVLQKIKDKTLDSFKLVVAEQECLLCGT